MTPNAPGFDANPGDQTAPLIRSHDDWHDLAEGRALTVGRGAAIARF